MIVTRGETTSRKGFCNVLSLIMRLFNHYCDHHFTVTLAGFPIFDGDGNQLGYVDRMMFGRNSVRVEGWCLAERVALGPSAKLDWRRPDIRRLDVNEFLGLSETLTAGFNLVWFGKTSGLNLALKSETTTLQILCPDVARWEWFKAQIHIRISFLKSVLRSGKLLLRAYFKPTPHNKSVAKRALGMHLDQIPHALDAQFFSAEKSRFKSENLTLIMPVFNAYDVLFESLERIVQNTDLPWRLILIEDCSTDKRVRPELDRWVERQRKTGADITVLANKTNLGFIGSVNRALVCAQKFRDHVVLINSDALVPANWATRLVAPIIQNSRIASVTPLSNDAEIFTAPLMCKRFDLKAGEADKIDEFLLKTASNHSHRNAPTGVGFCMAINRRYLQKVPQLDTVFGKGYGEEVDWCQKVKTLGGQHVVQPSLFVEHRGGTSFGNSAKQELIVRNNQVITKRYPNFDQSVQMFMAEDPVRTARVLIACAFLSTRQSTVNIYIAHSLGGGAEMYLQERIDAKLRLGSGAIVLRLGGVMRWRVEAHLGTGVIFGDTDDENLVHQIMKAVENGHYIYSCAVGDSTPETLPNSILTLAARNTAKITFLLHDYFAISPSYCLLDSDDIYRPSALLQNNDCAHVFQNEQGQTIELERWRQSWFELLSGANEIVCFSHSSVKILRTSFPNLQTEIIVEPHEIEKIHHVKLPASDRSSALGVLGDIGVQKGANCLQELSKVFPAASFHHITLIGSLDPRFSLGKGDVETGSYTRSDIAALTEQHNIAAWLIPSIWPETFSYTTHEALATGLPVFCFNIGAQHEAVRKAENGHVLPLELANQPHLILSHVTEVLENVAFRQRLHSRPKKPWRRSIAAQLKPTG